LQKTHHLSQKKVIPKNKVDFKVDRKEETKSEEKAQEVKKKPQKSVRFFEEASEMSRIDILK